jgi:AcrR family transcriptional regulator
LRVRTEDKRQRIIAVAGELFEELGYDRASMSLISERLGGSKTTLYGYFRSKEELLLAVLDVDIDTQAEALIGLFLAPESFRDGLADFGAAYLSRRLAPRPISFVRIVSSLGEQSDIPSTFYDRILKAAWMRLCRRFEEFMDEGRLRRADPWVAAMHFKGILEQDLFDKRLLGAVAEVDAATIERAAQDAADVFLRAYGPEAAEA